MQGNGGQVRYTYDDHKRLSAVTVDDDPSPAYTYAYNTANAAGQVTDHRLNRTLIAQYDTANRLMQPRERDGDGHLVWREFADIAP